MRQHLASHLRRLGCSEEAIQNQMKELSHSKRGKNGPSYSIQKGLAHTTSPPPLQFVFHDNAYVNPLLDTTSHLPISPMSHASSVFTPVDYVDPHHASVRASSLCDSTSDVDRAPFFSESHESRGINSSLPILTQPLSSFEWMENESFFTHQVIVDSHSKN